MLLQSDKKKSYHKKYTSMEEWKREHYSKIFAEEEYLELINDPKALGTAIVDDIIKQTNIHLSSKKNND